MSNSLNPVFGDWYTDKQLGSGTDGKVFSIYRTRPDGSRENSILKIIRLGENRNERPFIRESAAADEQQRLNYDDIISRIKRNIITVKTPNTLYIVFTNPIVKIPSPKKTAFPNDCLFYFLLFISSCVYSYI